jgi:hypothetical protein
MAIAKAEGFGPPQNLATRCNNPGNLTDDGDVGCGTALSTGIGATHITIYPTLVDGMAALNKKVRRALEGRSTVYRPEMSIEEVGMIWSKDADWGINVGAALGVKPEKTLEQLVADDPKSNDLAWPNA